MKRSKTPVVNSDLVSSAKLNEKAPKPKKQRFSWQKITKELTKLPWPWIGLSVAVIAIVAFVGITAYRHGNVNIATRSALDGLMKNRNSDIALNVSQSLYGSGDSPYEYSGTLSLRGNQTLRTSFTTSRNTKEEFNKGRLSQTDFIVSGDTSYLKFNIDSKLSYTGYDFKDINDKWYHYDITSDDTTLSTLYTIGQQLVINNSIDSNRLTCAIKSSNLLNDKLNRDAILNALLDSKFIKFSSFKSDKNGRYTSVNVDGERYADFAKAYRQTAYTKAVQSCLPKNSADLFGSEISVRETANAIKQAKPEVKLYLSGWLSSNIKRIELKTNSDQAMIGKLNITADFKSANSQIEAPSKATEIKDMANKLVVRTGE